MSPRRTNMLEDQSTHTVPEKGIAGLPRRLHLRRHLDCGFGLCVITIARQLAKKDPCDVCPMPTEPLCHEWTKAVAPVSKDDQAYELRRMFRLTLEGFTT